MRLCSSTSKLRMVCGDKVAGNGTDIHYSSWPGTTGRTVHKDGSERPVGVEGRPACFGLCPSWRDHFGKQDKPGHLWVAWPEAYQWNTKHSVTAPCPCKVDYWLLPQQQRGSLSLKLQGDPLLAHLEVALPSGNGPDFFAPKGPHKKAPGNARGTPAIPNGFRPERAEPQRASCRVLSGRSRRRGPRFPRALPGAFLCGPFGAMTANSTSQRNGDTDATGFVSIFVAGVRYSLGKKVSHPPARGTSAAALPDTSGSICGSVTAARSPATWVALRCRVLHTHALRPAGDTQVGRR